MFAWAVWGAFARLPAVSQAAAAAPSKDIWDKLSDAGTFVGSVLIAGALGLATLVYNNRQSKIDIRERDRDRDLARIKLAADLLPSLSSIDARLTEAGLVLLAALGNEDLAAQLAVIYAPQGGLGALGRLAYPAAGSAAGSAAAAGSRGAAQVALDKQITTLMRSVVRLMSGADVLALGFATGEPGVVVTAVPLVGPATLWTADGKVFARLVRSELSPTVSVLRADRLPPGLPLAVDDELVVGDQLIALSFDLQSNAWSYQRGRFDGYLDELLVLGGFEQPLLAGAPVLGRTGSVVAMVSRRRPAAVDEDIGVLAVPARQLRAILGGSASTRRDRTDGDQSTTTND